MRVIILLKEEKVKEGLQGVRGLGLITGTVFCLHIDKDISGGANIWGLMCQSTLNWVYML